MIGISKCVKVIGISFGGVLNDFIYKGGEDLVNKEDACPYVSVNVASLITKCIMKKTKIYICFGCNLLRSRFLDEA